MYYHARSLNHVAYGKIGPAPDEALDDDFVKAYRWLGRYCGFCPQVWLSRSRSAITGIRSSMRRAPDARILFGFEGIRGFPVRFDFWCELLNPLMNHPTGFADSAYLAAYFQACIDDPEWIDGPADFTWRATKDVETVLRRHLFVEHDQVVVPALNLKSAKRILCRDERQKRTLRRMGFIEDRIEILPLR